MKANKRAAVARAVLLVFVCVFLASAIVYVSVQYPPPPAISYRSINGEVQQSLDPIFAKINVTVDASGHGIPWSLSATYLQVTWIDNYSLAYATYWGWGPGVNSTTVENSSIMQRFIKLVQANNITVVRNWVQILPVTQHDVDWEPYTAQMEDVCYGFQTQNVTCLLHFRNPITNPPH